MTWFLVALSISLLFSLYVNVVVIRKNLQLSDQREELVSQIEESLDILDDCHYRVAHHADTPVMSNEPVIKEVVNDLKLARNVILAIASKVVTYGQEKFEQDEESDDQ